MGTIISTSIFTLPGIVAAQFAGPAVVFSFLIAAVVAGMVALAYAEMASVMPFAGSAYSWISVLFGEGFGWIAGWALLAVKFYCRSLCTQVSRLHFSIFCNLIIYIYRHALANPLGTNGGIVDIISLIVILIAALLVWRGSNDAGIIAQILVVLKIL